MVMLMSKRNPVKRYVKLFIRLSNSVEKRLLQLTWVCFLLLIAAQALLRWPVVRSFLSGIEGLEGLPYSQE
ncbi:hypothetical protein [Paenibacillus turpanensis]|uniref:hypothetical protein n=1 Tax=Paenibacillus turpanensis TaxID=2689078 RepID=UPI00140D148D|nr:hypothetical protein [Paenibacillus turpanensis]